jgi:alpha-ketoglutarate-dependent taurine dioxygenase
MKGLTYMTFAQPPGELPAVIEPDGSGRSIAELVESERQHLRTRLSAGGALLFRGFPVREVDTFGHLVKHFSGEPLAYSERSSPRTAIKGKVYTSTEYPPDQEIFLHNENSYQAAWPKVLYFYCATAPSTGGATPLADCRQVYELIDPAVRDEFERRGWMVVRNFHQGFGTTWNYVFDTDERADVEAHCARNRITFEWLSAGGLRTRAVRDAVHTHPGTGSKTWFNHITFFHNTTLPTEVREGLLAFFDEDDLPTNTYYGDGGRIPDEVVDHLRQCYATAKVRFDWQQDDVLVIDNMLVAHGRESFTGPRSIAVAMAELHEGVPR